LDLRGLVPKLVDLLREILTARQDLLVHAQPYPDFEKELTALVPPDFLRLTSFGRLAHFPRYLKAMKLRADRWRQNPTKDAERARQLAPYVAAAAEIGRARRGDPEAEALRWLVEEFRVSLFAQELGTAEPVSPVKLDRAISALRGGASAVPTESRDSPGATPPASPKPIVVAPVINKKAKPLKSLGGLDKLFPK
jgi:ATP-dependent helicase HrpA